MIVNYIFFLVTFLLFGGLALDTGLLELRRLSLQQAADAAAQEAMYQFARSDSSWITAGKAQAAMNGFTDGVNNVTVSIVNPPASGTYAGNTWVVQATVSQKVNTLFMGLVNGGQANVAATAFAKELPTCIWMMNDSGTSPGGSLQLASATLRTNCGVYVGTSGSSNQYNLRVDGFASLIVNANRIRVLGPATGNSSTGYINTQPKFAAAKKMDPLAYITAPTLSTCTYNNISYSGGSHTLSPGTYCGGITLSNSATVNLSPGLYVIAGGLSSSNSSIYGTGGVTLYFTKTSGSPSFSAVSMTGGTLNLKAPTTSANGCIPGVVVFGDRNWIDHGHQDVALTYVTVQSDGYWYLLNTGIYMWSTSFTYYSYNGLVVDNYYQYLSTNYFNSDFSSLGGVSPLHYEDGVLAQ